MRRRGQERFQELSALVTPSRLDGGQAVDGHLKVIRGNGVLPGGLGQRLIEDVMKWRHMADVSEVGPHQQEIRVLVCLHELFEDSDALAHDCVMKTFNAPNSHSVEMCHYDVFDVLPDYAQDFSDARERQEQHQLTAMREGFGSLHFLPENAYQIMSPVARSAGSLYRALTHKLKKVLSSTNVVFM
jgi:hypothetical protein